MKDGSGPVVRIYAHVGGNAAAYVPVLARALPGATLVPVDLPGSGRRFAEPLAMDIGEVAEAEALHLSRHSGSLFLYGHSLGGLVAFEVASRLERNGRSVDGLILSAVAPPPVSPHERRELPPWSDERVMERLRRVGGTPAVILSDAALMALFLPAVRNGFELVDRYYAPDDARPRCPAIVTGAREDPIVDSAGLDRWQHLIEGPTAIHRFGGGHMFPLAADRGWMSLIARFVDDHCRCVIR